MRAKTLSLMLIVGSFLGTVSAQEEQSCRGPQGPTHCNGISVGAPKVFDNRSLMLMLEALNQTLEAQQRTYIDQKSLLSALANLQGLSTQEVATNLNITAVPPLSRDVSTDLKTGNVSAGGAPLPNTFERKTDTNRASFTPQAPSLDTLPGLPSGFNPTFGSSASDLLSDQVNLTYQIFNLRMILERSLSDRLLPNAPTDDKTRLQVVLGFNVTIDPPRTANEAVAVVEIKVTTTEAGNLSLVSLMPQEKTYNAAALSSKSNAFGGAAVVSAFQVGFSARKRGQIFYLYRDTDTLSYERMTGKPNELVFGWMFRPVLGRRSISPGLRQMFSIVALPKEDCMNKEKVSCSANLKTSVRSFWKKYDRATLTSFVSRDANRARDYWYDLSLGLARPQIFDNKGYENRADYGVLEVESTATYQSDLSPVVEWVKWRPTGAENLVVSVRGNNFFSSTQVALGDKTYSTPENGLILKSNQGFDLTTTLDALANGPGAIIGRYGTSVPLILTRSSPQMMTQQSLASNGIEITNAEVGPSLAGIRRIDIYLRQKVSFKTQQELDQNRRNLLMSKGTAYERTMKKKVDEAEQRADAERELNVDQLPVDSLPIISVNGTALKLPYDIATDSAYHRVEIQTNLPDSVLTRGGGVIKITWPLYPPDLWTAAVPLYDPASAFQVTRVSEKSIVISRINGLGFTEEYEMLKDDTCWKLIAGDVAQKLETTACHPPKSEETVTPPKDKGTKDSTKKEPRLTLDLEFTIAATVGKLPSHVVLLSPIGTAYRLEIPELTDKKDDKPKPVELKQYDSSWVDIKLDADKTPAKVEANGKFLAWRSDDATKKTDDKTGLTIHVEVTRELTSKPGSIELIVLDGKGKVIATRQVAVSCTLCSDKGEK